MRFQVETLGDVLHAAFEVKHAALSVAHSPNVFLHPDDRAIATAHPCFVAAHRVIAANQQLPSLPISGINIKVIGIDAQQRVAVRIAERLDHGRIGINNFSLRRGFAKPDQNVVEQRQVPALRLL